MHCDYLLRARMYACIRRWDLAKADYLSIIRYYPSKKEEVTQLIQAIEPFKENALKSYWEEK